jgi:Xaa-Pro dipeptidase
MFEKIEQELFFTPEEYATRLRAIRTQMAQRGIDTLLCSSPENTYYGSGFQTFGIQNYAMLVIPMEKDPFLVLRFLESVQARRYAWVRDIATWDDLDDPTAVTVRELRNRGLADGTIGAEERGFFFQVANWKKLKDALPRLADGSGVVEAVRAVKSAQEIAYMKEAGRLTDIGVAAAAAEAREGRTDNDIAAAIFEKMTRAGSEWLARDPIVTTGIRSGLPHSCYMRQTLKQGDAILLEFSGVYLRYYAPIMRGLVIGRGNALVEKMSAVCIEALNAAMEKCRPGATSGDVDGAARAVIHKHGMWENYRKRSGYSVGTGFSSWMETGIASLKEDDPTVLAPGMCFHIPIATRVYDTAGIGFSETVVITETGCEPLSSSPRELVVC